MDRRCMFKDLSCFFIMKKKYPQGGSVVCQVYWYISEVSDVRLQDHWSSG